VREREREREREGERERVSDIIKICVVTTFQNSYLEAAATYI
jgi:hypothetical protein